MKMLIGFIMGIMVASVAAETSIIEVLKTAKVGLLSGVNPAGDASIIRVDANGYVICSTEAR